MKYRNSIGGISIGPLYSTQRMPDRSASGGAGKDVSLKRSTFSLSSVISELVSSCRNVNAGVILGLTFDTKSKWREHIETIRQKTTSTVHTLNSLGSSTWGIRLQDMRRLYEAIAILQMRYACSIWANANLKDKKRSYTHKTLEDLRSIQARAARSICGAYKATSRADLILRPSFSPSNNVSGSTTQTS